MPGFILNDGAVVPPSVYSAMNIVLNKKLGTSQVYPPRDWAAIVKDLVPLPLKSASGSIASFPDGADDVPIKSGRFNIDYNSSGVSGMNIQRTGKNLFNEDTELGTINDTTGIPNPSTTQIRSKTFSLCKGGKNYSVNVGSNNPIRVLWYDSGENFISETINITNTVITSPNNASLFKIRGTNAYGTTYRNDVAINYPSTDTAYEAYSSDTYPVSFGTTIYGGYFESETGVLTSTKASDGTDLQPPVEYQLTPVGINSRYGANNIFLDLAGSECEVEYYADPTLSTQ